MFWVLHWRIENIIENLFFRLSLKRGIASGHLIHQSSNAIVVDWEAMPFPPYNLRRHIRRTPTKRIAFSLFVNIGFRNPKINELDISLSIQQNIFWLEIPIDNTLAV